MNTNVHQGLFGESFVRILASAAGLIVSRPDPDITGEDFTLTYPGRIGRRRNPKIEVQVKSWSKMQTRWDNGVWKYRMRAAHFNQLAGTDSVLARYLFLVIVPADAEDYATSHQGHLVLQHSAYWMSLHEFDEVDTSVKDTVAVDVPGSNLLTVQALRSLIEATVTDEVPA